MNEVTRNRIFERYAKYIWPIHRFFVRGLSDRCKKCILSKKYIHIGKDGICDECKAYIGKKCSVPNINIIHEFNEKVNYYMSFDREYHAIFMLSGGKDSAYVINRLVVEFPNLRLLCVNVDNGFASHISLQNVEYISGKLKVDSIIVRSHFERFKNAFRSAFLQLGAGKKSYEIVDFADGTIIYDIGKNIAKSMNIPAVFCGLSEVQSQMILKMDGFELENIGEPNIIFPLAAWRTSEIDIHNNVRELKLIPRGNDSPLITNNCMIATMCVIDIMNNGYCSFEPEFAKIIREGTADRRKWLYIYEMLEHATRKKWLEKDVVENLGKLGLTLEDVVKEK